MKASPCSVVTAAASSRLFVSPKMHTSLKDRKHLKRFSTSCPKANFPNFLTMKVKADFEPMEIYARSTRSLPWWKPIVGAVPRVDPGECVKWSNGKVCQVESALQSGLQIATMSVPLCTSPS